MKKFILTCLIFSVLCIASVYAWEWEPFGPDGIKANKLCFFEWNYINAVACMDTGMYIIDDSGAGFTYHSYAGMEVVEVVSAGFDLNSDSILLIMSDGSYSDGIYSFSSQSGQFTPLYFCIDPYFILKSSGKYFVGYDNGLLISEDGGTWTDIPFFTGKACIDMTTNYEHFIVATDEAGDNTYHAFPDPDSWVQIVGSHITELADNNFYNYNSFFGINEETSGNGGFFELNVIQNVWENVFYSSHLNAIGRDNGYGIFVGWYNGIEPITGIASCFPELTWLNDGLPNLNIHSITAPEIFGCSIVYCCTDNGIYSRILSVGIPEKEVLDEISVFPNPSSGQINIMVNLPDFNTNCYKILIFDHIGIKVDEIKVESISSQIHLFTWNKGNLPAGIYYLVVRTQNKTFTEKFVVL